MPNHLEVSEGLQFQGPDERIVYTVTTTNWVSSPTSPTVVAYDEDGMVDVTSTGGATGSGVFPANTPSAAGDEITLSLLRDLIVRHTYRIEVKFTVSTTIYECYFRVKCEDK